MKITVTREDIKSGQRKCSITCPLALAINRAINKTVTSPNFAPFVFVKPTYMVTDRMYDLPWIAQMFIKVFDAGWGWLLPAFSFELKGL
jgi:hypothetical protein